ncbi:RHS repeat-associated core domain-containing protein [Stenotrophomonas sp. C1657]|uniref:RHS repeat domain-containing protein n=2 Tax=unclassified Stenotrophomonas TaxID=196198 RepID=UPI001F0F8A8C|nr:RHS repeat-associated core domain-containing protein [Stenotrophomonas sp. TEPEL]MDV3513392.1 RHS repeat-associated core domain-containing protein [Stenotrophomonas sp. C1657]
MRRIEIHSGGRPARFGGIEGRVGKLMTDVTLRCCILVIGLVLSIPVMAQTVTYIHTDALGSVVAESDANGNVIKRYDYEPYGAVVGGQVTDGPGYTGHVSDSATGLSYMQQRYMDPQLGVFLSVDPVTAYEQPVGQFNRYRYANGNPYKFTDPDGRQSWSDFQTGFENGTLNASRYEHGFPLHANWAEQTGYAIGSGIVKGGQSHAGGIRAPPLRMQPPRTGVVTVGAVTKPTKSPDINPKDIAGRTAGEIDGIAKQSGLQPKGPDPSAGKGAYVDPVNGNQRVLVHPNAACGPHCHVNDASGQRLDINGKHVAPESPAAHLPLKTK